MDAKVVLGSRGSLKFEAPAAPGPWFFTTAVMVTVVPARVVGDEEVMVVSRSAPVARLTVVRAVAELFAKLGSDVPEVMLSTSAI